MIVYHGSSEIVTHPDIVHSYRPFDFGRGFYVTTNKEQAIRWARGKSKLKKSEKSYVNVYDLSSDESEYEVKVFADDLMEWIDFVCNCRDGGTEYTAFDIIKAYPGYDQIAFVSQKAIDGMLTFLSVEEV